MFARIMIVSVLLAAGALAGCGSVLSKPYPQKTRYAIMLSTPAAATPAMIAHRTPESLCIRDLAVNEPFNGLSLVYRTGAATFETDYYNTFVAAPDRLLAGVLEQYLSQTGLFGGVFRNAGSANCQYLLEGDVLGLYGDYTDRSKPLAVLKIRFFLIDDAEGAAKVLFVRQFDHSEPLKSADPAALVEGWSRGMAAILGQLASEIAKALPAPTTTATE